MNEWTPCWKARKQILKEPEMQNNNNKLKKDCISRNKWKKWQLQNSHWQLAWWFWKLVPVTSCEGGNTQPSQADGAPWQWQAIYTHCTRNHMHCNTHTHALFRDMGPVLTTAKLPWHGGSGGIQRKQSRPTRGLGLLCLWSVTLHHEGNP